MPTKGRRTAGPTSARDEFRATHPTGRFVTLLSREAHRRSRKFVLGAIGGSALSLPAAATAQADVITHFGTGVGATLGPHLDAVGIGASNVAAETDATSFFVGGPTGTNTTLTFHLV